MALLACPDCGSQVSTQAEACPSCGRRSTSASAFLGGTSPAVAFIAILVAAFVAWFLVQMIV